MSDDKQVRPFDAGSGPSDNTDEESLRQQWQSGDAASANERKSQARRLIGRRPLLKGLGAGAGLLLASAGELGALLSGVTPAYAAADDEKKEDDDEDEHRHHRTTTSVTTTTSTTTLATTTTSTTTLPTTTSTTTLPGG